MEGAPPLKRWIGSAWATRFGLFLAVAAWALAAAAAAGSFTVASFNVENYLIQAEGNRPAKSVEARRKVRQCIRALDADVIALQEMGNPEALRELRDALRREGAVYPHWEHVKGYDPYIFVSVLSRFPIVARRSHEDERFLLDGRRLRSSRGFAEVDIRLPEGYTFTLLSAHLKSRRPVGYADQADVREQEALLLRRKVDTLLSRDPHANVVVVGDFNDTKDTPAVRTLIGKGRTALVDTRPAERNGDTIPSPRSDWDPRRIAWTYFYGKEDSYERIDYILLSTGMANEWIPRETYVLTVPNWGLASDHRPIIATFSTEDR